MGEVVVETVDPAKLTQIKAVAAQCEHRHTCPQVCVQLAPPVDLPNQMCFRQLINYNVLFLCVIY